MTLIDNHLGGNRIAGGRLVRRLGQLYLGLALYGASMALMIESTLGLDPWDVFHQGIAETTGLTIGTVTVLVGAAVLLLWIPLRQRPGLGTVSNVLVIGVAVDATLALLPTARPLPVQVGYLVAGILANGAATGLYIGARLGPGPRDGLMTGYVARHPGQSLRFVRTVIEVTVLAAGWALGGTVGIGTVAYALSIGPLAQLAIAVCTVPEARAVPSSGHRTGRFRRSAESADAIRSGSEATLRTSRTHPGVGKRSPAEASAKPQREEPRADRAPTP